MVLYDFILLFLIEEKLPELDPDLEGLQAKFDQLQADYDELVADEDAPPSKYNELFENYNELLEATEDSPFEIDSEYKELLSDVNELTDNYLNVLEAVDSFENEIRTSSLVKKILGYPIEALIFAITIMISVFSKTRK